MTNHQKIDLLIQYILSVAGQEDWDGRELGMIHIIKYAYLADLAHAPYHEGRTFTGAPWRFHHYGPWSEEIYRRIEPALEAIHACRKTIHSSKYERDFIRWSITGEAARDALERRMDLGVAGVVQKNVRRFGADTAMLLHHVYQTEPMLRAAPGERLDFSAVAREFKSDDDDNALESDQPSRDRLTARQKKKRKERYLELKRRLNERLEKELKPKARPFFTPPRYDEVYAEGVAFLDRLAGRPLEPMERVVVFPDDVWKSKARFDPDVP